MKIYSTLKSDVSIRSRGWLDEAYIISSTSGKLHCKTQHNRYDGNLPEVMKEFSKKMRDIINERRTSDICGPSLASTNHHHALISLTLQVANMLRHTTDSAGFMQMF